MSKYRLAFHDHLKEVVNEGQSHLNKNGWVDPATGGPDADVIIELIRPFLGDQQQPPPWEADIAVSMGDRMGSAHEALGDLPAALNWYRVGQYSWRGGVQIESAPQSIPDYGRRMTAGMLQMEAAICAARAEEAERAGDLFTWTVKNRSFTQEELVEFDKTKQPAVVWEWTTQKAFALLCLEQWKDALDAAENALHWVEKDSKARIGSSHEMPLMILPVVLALARYKLYPSGENRVDAIKMLDPQVVASRSHVDHLIGLFYLFNLRAKHPNLANPAEDEHTTAARVKQGADACREWMGKTGTRLDGTTESLKLLDLSLRKIYPTIEEDEELKMMIFLWGSYFGEVVRKELAGGQWNFSADSLLSSTLDWDMGEIELHLWPFQRVMEYASGQTDKNLFDLWEETERAYIDVDLAAQSLD